MEKVFVKLKLTMKMVVFLSGLFLKPKIKIIVQLWTKMAVLENIKRSRSSQIHENYEMEINILRRYKRKQFMLIYHCAGKKLHYGCCYP